MFLCLHLVNTTHIQATVALLLSCLAFCPPVRCSRSPPAHPTFSLHVSQSSATLTCTNALCPRDHFFSSCCFFSSARPSSTHHSISSFSNRRWVDLQWPLLVITPLRADKLWYSVFLMPGTDTGKA